MPLLLCAKDCLLKIRRRSRSFRSNPLLEALTSELRALAVPPEVLGKSTCAYASLLRVAIFGPLPQYV